MNLLCGGCGRNVEVGDDHAGGAVNCPHCGHGIRVPTLGSASAEDLDAEAALLTQDEDLADEFLTKAKLALKKKMLVQCGACKERLTVQHRLAGKVVRCPSCGGQIQLPALADEESFQPRKPVFNLQATDETSEEAGGSADLQWLAEPAEKDKPESTAAPAGTTELAAAVVAAEGEHRPPGGSRPAVLPHKPRRSVKSRSVLMLAVVLLAAAGGAMVTMRLLEQMPQRPAEPNVPAAQAPSPQPPPGPMEHFFPDDPNRSGKSPSPAPSPAPPPTATAPVPAPAPAPVPAASRGLEVVEASVRVLGGDGWVPAPIGRDFLHVKVRLTAGEQPINFDTGAVTLESGGGQTPSLGAATGEVLSAARPAAVSIPPGTALEPTLAFLVGPDFAGATLKINGVGQAAVPAPKKPAPPSAQALAGRYVEAARYLKLGFEDPVMEKLRESPRLNLQAERRSQTFGLVVSPAGLRGEAKFESDGLYAATLSDGAHSLQCHLRLCEDGARLVLYLAEAPFHQIVYDRQ